MRVTPKMSDRPAARRNSELALASPFKNCRRTAAPLTPGCSILPQCADFLVGRLVARAVGVAPVDHHALVVLLRELSDVGAHRRLVVERPPDDRAKRRLLLQAL